jgi:hypothetical protein
MRDLDYEWVVQRKDWLSRRMDRIAAEMEAER